MLKVFFLVFGFIFLVSGFTYFILYLNLFTFGYSLVEYLEFMLLKRSTILFFVGLIMILILLFWKGRNHT